MLTVRLLGRENYEKFFQVLWRSYVFIHPDPESLFERPSLLQRVKSLFFADSQKFDSELIRISFEPYFSDAGGGFLFIMDEALFVGFSAFRKIDTSCARLDYFYRVAEDDPQFPRNMSNLDPRIPSILWDQVFRAFRESGYARVYLSLEILGQVLYFPRDAAGNVITDRSVYILEEIEMCKPLLEQMKTDRNKKDFLLEFSPK